VILKQYIQSFSKNWEAKEYNKTQDFKDDMKERAHIEPKNAEMKRFHGIE